MMKRRVNAKIGEAIGCEFEDGDDLLEAVKELVRERDEARAKYQWMVNRACDEKLEGYRELAAKCAQLEEERDEARADAERYLADLRRCASEPYERTRELEALQAEVERLREMAHDFEAMREDRDEAQEAYREARASRWHVSKKWDEALKEIERLRTENRDMSRAVTDAIEIQRNACADAYRRGAEAMREACQQWCRAWENNGEAIADALADLRVEDKP